MTHPPARWRLPIDGFLATMLSAVALALMFPAIGRSDGPLHLGIVTNVGVALVFLLHGANLATDKLVAGMRPGGCTSSFSCAPSRCFRSSGWCWPGCSRGASSLA